MPPDGPGTGLRSGFCSRLTPNYAACMTFGAQQRGKAKLFGSARVKT